MLRKELKIPLPPFRCSAHPVPQNCLSSRVETLQCGLPALEKEHWIPRKQLKETQRSFQQRIQQREKDLQQLREAVESHKRSAHTAVEDSERIFTELIRSIERSRSEATQRIRDQEKTAVSRAEERLERLEQEINDLRRRDAELEQLSHTQDHIHFLQSFQSLSAPPESTDVNDNLFSSLSSFDGVRESVRQLRDKLEDFCKEELKKISDRVTFSNIVPRTRNDFLQYSHQLNLDLNTVNKYLRLSERNRVITDTYPEIQSYPDHPDRFDGYNPQSFQSLSAPPESTDVNDNLFSSLSSFDGVRESVRQLRDKLEDFCKEELKKISDRVTFSNIVPRTRNDFLQYSHQLTLDLNTVNKHLRLSERNRVITVTYPEIQSYPDHPDRFDGYNPQVLCRESVCGRCYWEIEWSGIHAACRHGRDSSRAHWLLCGNCTSLSIEAPHDVRTNEGASRPLRHVPPKSGGARAINTAQRGWFGQFFMSSADFASLDPERKPRRLSQAPSGISASEAAGRHLAAFSRRFC
ncbi:unnamed protein product [Leuciscus chuanchicus]